MSKSKNGKKGEKALIAVPAVEGKQKLETEVESQAEPRGDAALNAGEEMKLTQFEQILEQNLNSFIFVGRALKAIQNEKLYRVKFRKFEDYCRERWNLSDKYAYRLIDAYTCVDMLGKELSPTGETRFPTNESQVRPLTSLAPEKQVKAWQQVLKVCKDKPITAVEVEEVANKMLGQPSKKDATKPKAATKKVEQGKLVKIGKLVAEALEEDESELTVPKLKKILEKIQKMIEAKK